MDTLEPYQKKAKTALDIFAEEIWVDGADIQRFARQTTKFCRKALDAPMVMLWECDYSLNPPILRLLSYDGNYYRNFNAAMQFDEGIIGHCVTQTTFLQINDLLYMSYIKIEK